MHDEYIVSAEKAMIGVGRATSFDKYWMNVLPVFKYIPSWIPGADSREIVNVYAPYVKQVRTQPFQEVKMAIVSSILLPVSDYTF